MPRRPNIPHSERNCSWARTLDILGDSWSLLVIRELMVGVDRFTLMQERLGISKGILTARLKHLADHGLVEVIQKDKEHPRYGLTEKGCDLFAVLVGIGQWGDKWVFGKDNEPISVLDGRSGSKLAPLKVQTTDGVTLSPEQLRFEAGPGANDATRQSLAKLLSSKSD